ISWLKNQLNSENSSQLQKIVLDQLYAGNDIDSPDLKKQLLDMQKEAFVKLKTKAKIECPDSTRVLGVCDPFGKLEYGQVFIRVQAGLIIFHKIYYYY